jgi:hypothetical protein
MIQLCPICTSSFPHRLRLLRQSANEHRYYQVIQEATHRVLTPNIVPNFQLGPVLCCVLAFRLHNFPSSSATSFMSSPIAIFIAPPQSLCQAHFLPKQNCAARPPAMRITPATRRTPGNNSEKRVEPVRSQTHLPINQRFQASDLPQLRECYLQLQAGAGLHR